MRRKTVISVVCCTCLACIFSLLAFVWQKPEEAAAETLEQKTVRMTSSDRFSFRSVEGRMTEADIVAYAASAYQEESTLFGSTVEYTTQNNVLVSGDDPIVAIIPREYFTQDTQRLYIGEEYGFFINTEESISTLLLFDIVKELAIKETGTVTVSVYPILEQNYAYYTKSFDKIVLLEGVENAVIPYRNSNDGFVPVDKYNLKNVSFEAFLMNENEYNYGIDYEYDKTKDDGHFFIGTHYYYNGYYNESAGMSGGEVATEIVAFAAGFIPYIGPLISTVYTFASIASSYTDIETISVNNTAIKPNFYPSTKVDQLAQGGLVKHTYISGRTAGFLLKPQDNIFNGNVYNQNAQFAKAVFQVSRTADWRARFAAGLHIEVVDKDGQPVLQQDYLQNADILGDDINDEVILDATDKNLPETDVRTLPGGVQTVSFRPTYKGTYTLTATPVKAFDRNNLQTDVYGLPVPIDPSTASVRVNGHGYNVLNSLIFTADAGDEHVFDISFVDSNHYGHIRIDVTVTELALDTPVSTVFSAQKQTVLKIKPEETQIFKLTAGNQNLFVEICTGDGIPLAAPQKGYTYAHLDATLLYYAVFTNDTAQDIETIVCLQTPPEKDLFSETALTAAVRPEYVRFSLPHAGTYGITFAEAGTDAPTLALDTTLHVVGENRTISTVNYNDLHAKTINFSVSQPTVVDMLYRLADARTAQLTCVLVEKTAAPQWVIVKADGQRIENASYYFAKRGEQFRVLIRENDAETSVPIHFTQESADNWSFHRNTGSFHVKPTAILLNASAVLKPQLLYYTKDNIIKTLNIYPLHAIESLIVTAATDTDGPYGIDITLDAPLQTREEVWANLSIELPNGNIYAYPAVQLKAGVTNHALASFIDSRYNGVENCTVRLTDLRYKRYQPNGVLDFEVIVYNDKALTNGALLDDQKINAADCKVNPKFLSGLGIGIDPFIITRERHFRNMDYSIAKISRWYSLGARLYFYDTKSIVNDFRGKFNGNNHTLYVTIFNITEPEIGLFKYASGTIEKLIVSPSYIFESNVTLVGGIAARSTAEYKNCSVVTGNRFRGYDFAGLENGPSRITIGGLVGEASKCKFFNCSSNIEIQCYYRDGFIGGLIGNMYYCTINECMLENTITYCSYSSNTGSIAVGGIAGYSEGSRHVFGQGKDTIHAAEAEFDIRNTIVQSKIKDTHNRCNDDSDNGNVLCPYVGKFIGKCDTKLFYIFSYGSYPGPWRGTLDPGELHVATWKTGWWIFATEHSFDQRQNFGGDCGVGEIGFAY